MTDDGGAGPRAGANPSGERFLRVNGVVVMVVLILLGLASGAVYYHWKAPDLIARLRAEKAELPVDGVGRLEHWMVYGAPMVHNRMSYLRISRQQPWLVTHMVEHAGEAPEVWGLDFSELSPSITTQVGMQVRITLPATKMLARTELVGDNARGVPHYKAGDPIPDSDARAAALIERALRNPGDFIGALEKDIAGASLVVIVGNATAGSAAK